MVDLFQIESIIRSVFEDGYLVGGAKLSCSTPLSAIIKDVSEDSISIDFTENLPTATIKRLVSLSFQIQGVVFRKDSGTLRIKHFPDINFKYSKEEAIFGQTHAVDLDFSEIEKDICKEYDDDVRKFLAHRCLQYANEWATIASYGGQDFRSCGHTETAKLKRQCGKFIKESLYNNQDLKYGSVILTFILLQVLLPIIIKWIVEKVFRKLTS